MGYYGLEGHETFLAITALVPQIDFLKFDNKGGDEILFNIG